MKIPPQISENSDNLHLLLVELRSLKVAFHHPSGLTECGLETSNPFGVSDEQALLILGQFASSSAEEKVKKTNFALERVEKRKAITKATFEKQPEQPPKKRKRDNKQRKRYFDNPDESTASFDDDLQIIGSES